MTSTRGGAVPAAPATGASARTASAAAPTRLRPMCIRVAKIRDVARNQRIVLVEGASDQVALEALAERRGRDLEADGVSVMPIGGAQSISRFLDKFGPRGLGAALAGLCDAAEEGEFRRALEHAGLGSDLTRADMERLGFYVCVADLE